LNPAARDILQRRAARYRLAPPQAVEESACACLDLAGLELALPLDALLACLPVSQASPLPLASRGMSGWLAHQGQALCLYDLSFLAGVRSWPADPLVALVLELAGGRLAVACPAAPREIALPAAWLSEALGRAPAEGCLRRLERPDGRLLAWLDPGLLAQQMGAGFGLG